MRFATSPGRAHFSALWRRLCGRLRLARLDAVHASPQDRGDRHAGGRNTGLLARRHAATAGAVASGRERRKVATALATPAPSPVTAAAPAAGAATRPARTPGRNAPRHPRRRSPTAAGNGSVAAQGDRGPRRWPARCSATSRSSRPSRIGRASPRGVRQSTSSSTRAAPIATPPSRPCKARSAARWIPRRRAGATRRTGGRWRGASWPRTTPLGRCARPSTNRDARGSEHGA